MSGKVLRTEETWEIAEDLGQEYVRAFEAGPSLERQGAYQRYLTALRFHSWPHEIPQETR